MLSGSILPTGMMAAEASAFKRYEEGLRPGLIENKQVDMVPSLDDRRLADLIYQLDRDVALRGKETDIHKLIQAARAEGATVASKLRDLNNVKVQTMVWPAGRLPPGASFGTQMRPLQGDRPSRPRLARAAEARDLRGRSDKGVRAVVGIDRRRQRKQSKHTIVREPMHADRRLRRTSALRQDPLSCARPNPPGSRGDMQGRRATV